MSTLDFRIARRSDARAIALMSRDLIESGLGWSWRSPRVIRHIQDPETVVLIAEGAGKMAGFAIMEFDDEDAHLKLLAVNPRFQRHGVGRQLLEWLDATARVAGVTTIFVEVRTRNRAGRRFYRKLGYREIAYLPGYYSGKESAIRMLRDPEWQDSDARLSV